MASPEVLRVLLRAALAEAPSVERFDDLWGGGATGVSAYTVYADGPHDSLECVAPGAPVDCRPSIAGIIEVFVPIWRG